MEAVSLVKTYQDNEKKIKEVSEQRDKFQEQKEKKIRHLKYKEYYEKIRALEEERDAKAEILQNEKTAKEEKANNQIEQLYKPIVSVERILYFIGLKINKTWLNFDEKKIHASRDREISLIEKFYQDEFLKTIIVIYENDKPKNKYSLVVVGRCSIENTDILGLPKGYTYLSTKDSWYFNIEKNIKDLPTAEELKEHLTKNRQKILKDFMEKYQTVKKELIEVKQTYKIDDFKKIIKYRCKKCDFFLTERKARGYGKRYNNCPACATEGFWEKT